MNYGRTIRIYLADGSPTGIRHAELVNWTGQAIVCPRARIGELAVWDESKRPGVYILFGENPSGTNLMAYIGEAENVLDRMCIPTKSITDSGGSRSRIPREADHRFRRMPITLPERSDDPSR